MAERVLDHPGERSLCGRGHRLVDHHLDVDLLDGALDQPELADRRELAEAGDPQDGPVPRAVGETMRMRSLCRSRASARAPRRSAADTNTRKARCGMRGETYAI